MCSRHEMPVPETVHSAAPAAPVSWAAVADAAIGPGELDANVLAPTRPREDRIRASPCHSRWSTPPRARTVERCQARSVMGTSQVPREA